MRSRVVHVISPPLPRTVLQPYPKDIWSQGHLYLWLRTKDRPYNTSIHLSTSSGNWVTTFRLSLDPEGVNDTFLRTPGVPTSLYRQRLPVVSLSGDAQTTSQVTDTVPYSYRTSTRHSYPLPRCLAIYYGTVLVVYIRTVFPLVLSGSRDRPYRGQCDPKKDGRRLERGKGIKTSRSFKSPLSSFRNVVRKGWHPKTRLTLNHLSPSYLPLRYLTDTSSSKLWSILVWKIMGVQSIRDWFWQKFLSTFTILLILEIEFDSSPSPLSFRFWRFHFHQKPKCGN